jgi:enediyne biosynthesis protein E4
MMQVPLFEHTQNIFDKHEEDDYVDFYFERNIPFMLSKQGPKAALGDVNGDGLEDIYIGGANNQPGQLYLQTGTGFIKKESPDFKTYVFADVTAVLFFDCDKDGDLDLFTGGGGNFASESSGSFQNLLYINDGGGTFKLKRGAIPISNTNCGVVVPLDYNGDGNIDLFTGSRSVPQNYGTDPHSFILHNNGKGDFTDATTSVAPSLATVGMVTAAAYNDINGDGKKELIITGEWMYPHVFSYNGKGFEEIKSGLENLYGWWQSIAVTDADLDGDQDLILGNLGENFYLEPDFDNPVKIWMKDFDKNGTIDKIFTRTIENKEVPVFTKREITDQIPSLKKLNLKHHEYATKTIQQLFGNEIENAVVKKVNYPASCIAYNDGKGQFSIKKLPVEVQLSSINSIRVIDINKDGYPDIVAGGNYFDLLPQFCRLDASYGHILINDKKGNYLDLPSAKTGISVNGQTRDIVLFKHKNEDYILFLENNDYPVLYKMKSQ